MSKDRNLDDAELANISGAGDEKDLASAGDDAGDAGKPGFVPAPSGGDTVGGADQTDTAGGTGGNQDLTE